MYAKVTVHTRKTHSLTLSREELLAVLRLGLGTCQLPEDAIARILDDTGALTITWTTEETR